MVPRQISRLDGVLLEVEQELHRAIDMYPRKFAGAHEGWAKLYEEVDELWEQVRTKTMLRDKEVMRKEAVQVAAMAARFILDVCEEGTYD